MRSRYVGAALALLTAAFFAPASARAGCVHLGEGRPVVADHFDLLRMSEALASSARVGLDAEAPLPRGDRPGECSGPSCSGRPGMPWTPPSVASPRISQWAVLDAVPPAIAPANTQGSRDDGESWQNPSGLAVFHPPRLTSLVA